MDNQQVENILKQMELRETDDLIEIWQKHDTTQWSDAAFEAISRILTSRIGELPPFEDRETADELLQQAEVFLQDNEFDKALEQCNLAIQSAHLYGYAYYIKGMVYDEMDELEEAAKLYEEALRLSPKLKKAKKELSWVLTELSQKNTGRDERLLAALAHGGILIGIIGIIVPAVIWITQREKSRYVAFQALQALAFQFFVNCLHLADWVVYTVRAISLAIPSLSTTAFPVWMDNIRTGMSVLFAISWLTGMIGAVSTLRGKAFEYMWVSATAKKWLLP